jgi:transposase, IS5 family
MQQKTFLDMISRSPKGGVLDDILALLDWGPVELKLKRIVASRSGGRPSYPALNMFKILLLQQLYDLSDPEMEHHLYDRLSFRSFCGFGMSEALPDETTICRFRLSLVGKSEKLFDLILEQIEAKGLVIHKGTLVDASVIKAHCKRPPAQAQSETDPEAGWTKKQGQFTYGYKAHVGVDQGTGIVVKNKIPSASFHDSQVILHVVTGEEEAVYADKAYDSKKIKEELGAVGIKPRIIKRKKKGQVLSRLQAKLNRGYGKIRCHVERVFAHLKEHHGYRRARYRGWDKNQVHLDLLLCAYNLKRMTSLVKKRLLQEQCA